MSAVYGTLIPSGTLAAADAHALVRAGELARAFGSSATAPPEALVTELTRETRDLLARVRERLAEPEQVPESAVVASPHPEIVVAQRAAQGHAVERLTLPV